MIEALIRGLFGLTALLAIAFAFSENRRAIAWRPIMTGVGLQLILAIVMLKAPGSKEVFLVLNKVVMIVEEATTAGTSFVFGYLGGGPPPFAESGAGSSFIIAFRALPLILVISSISSLLFYWRILPVIVRSFSLLLQRSMNIGGAAGLGAAANIFVGMIEAPLFIRPYLAKMSRGEIFIIMSTGMSTIAGTMMVLYAGLLGPVVPGALGHLLIASIISAPAAITIAQIMVPDPASRTAGEMLPSGSAGSAMDAVVEGAEQGMRLLLTIISMLIVFLALVHLVNRILGFLPHPNQHPITMQLILGYILAPVVWLIGIPWSEAVTAGGLMGTKTVLNEFIAYADLANLADGGLSPRSQLIMIYALCGFANFGSLGIMVGGIGAMAPKRRKEIVSLGLKSIVAGTLATCMTGALVGMLM